MVYQTPPEVALHLRRLLDEHAPGPGLHDLLVQVMSRPGRALNPARPSRWPPLVLLPCRALAGAAAAGVLAAAAVELAIAAGNLVDDVVDDEWHDPDVPTGRALNAGLALLWLAQAATADLVPLLGTERTLLVGRLLWQGAVAGCGGQDLDLSLEAKLEAGESDAYDMVCRKSGSLAAAACQVGAAVATAEQRVLELVGQLGRHVGVVAQLNNDIHGVVAGSDLRRRKKTLPVTYALRCAREEGIPWLLEWYASPTVSGGEEAVAAKIRELGGLDYAWVVAEAHRQEAFALLERLAAVTGRPEVAELRCLVPSLAKLDAGSTP